MSARNNTNAPHNQPFNVAPHHTNKKGWHLRGSNNPRPSNKEGRK